jgi:hypothetical protein
MVIPKPLALGLYPAVFFKGMFNGSLSGDPQQEDVENVAIISRKI